MASIFNALGIEQSVRDQKEGGQRDIGSEAALKGSHCPLFQSTQQAMTHFGVSCSQPQGVRTTKQVSELTNFYSVTTILNML